jgi:hypothetical protein
MLQRYLSKSRQHQSSVIHIQVSTTCPTLISHIGSSKPPVHNKACASVPGRGMLYTYQRGAPALRASEARRSLYCFTFSADFSFVR